MAVDYRKVGYSKKLLADHSEHFWEYLRGLYRTGGSIAEFKVGHLNLNDIDIVSFDQTKLLADRPEYFQGLYWTG